MRIRPPELETSICDVKYPREDELSATNLAPSGGEERWQSTEIGFGSLSQLASTVSNQTFLLSTNATANDVTLTYQNDVASSPASAPQILVTVEFINQLRWPTLTSERLTIADFLAQKLTSAHVR
ncbi:hypothetical protein F511_41484 [Dorcoceras hygrometricum]|uniref:Uncharacterized protein n=1 Tax=Dorcoceras hygrometricum TaxID=472368 RepID=A0A2Z7CH39_9LAMI|nr:hypothetical protein F511_41484 [Dorcoceras hygrometricum]